jgi:hypothetical protein
MRRVERIKDMSKKELSLPEIAALVVLMAEARELSNPELKTRYGLTLDGRRRENLNRLKLVESRKEGRAFVHLLTDSGWVRVAEEMRSGTVAPGGSPGAIIKALVHGLHRFLDRTDGRLSDVFLPDEDAPDRAGGSGTGTAAIPVGPVVDSSRTDGAARPADPVGRPGRGSAARDGESAADVADRIRVAYAKLAPRPGDWVSLRRLRPLLGDVARTEVDAALKRMTRMPDVSIVPESNQKTLTPQDREAAVVIGDQDKHLIAIEAR